MAPGEHALPNGPTDPVPGHHPGTGHLEGPEVDWPMQLVDLHRRTAADQVVRITLATDTSGRLRLGDVIVGGGFDIVDSPDDEALERRAESSPSVIRAVRRWTLPDTVSADMQLLVCGLNPSPTSADRGVGFGRPGNRFWPAAVQAGLVSRPFDADNALRQHGIGMTDLAKRTTKRPANSPRRSIKRVSSESND